MSQMSWTSRLYACRKADEPRYSEVICEVMELIYRDQLSVLTL